MIDDARMAEAIALREAGRGVEYIARRFGNTGSAWWWRFAVIGVFPHGQAPSRPEEKPHDREIVRLRREGLGHRAIGKLIGRGHSYVQHRLLRIAIREAWDEEHANV